MRNSACIDSEFSTHHPLLLCVWERQARNIISQNTRYIFIFQHWGRAGTLGEGETGRRAEGLYLTDIDENKHVVNDAMN